MALLKIVLAPILIGLVSLAERKWGSVTSGLLVGLPLTSGPVLLILSLEHGPAFASRAAVGCLLGQFALASFTVTYARVARSYRWISALLLGVGVYLLVAAVLLEIPMKNSLVFVLVCIALFSALRTFPRTTAAIDGPVAIAKGELLMRMAIAAGVVALLTTVAKMLGAEVSGLLAPFPVYTGIVAVFNHIRSSDSAISVLKGVTTGAFCATAFCGIVMAGTSMPRALCFATATLTALGAAFLLRPAKILHGKQEKDEVAHLAERR